MACLQRCLLGTLSSRTGDRISPPPLLCVKPENLRGHSLYLVCVRILLRAIEDLGRLGGYLQGTLITGTPGSARGLVSQLHDAIDRVATDIDDVRNSIDTCRPPEDNFKRSTRLVRACFLGVIPAWSLFHFAASLEFVSPISLRT